MYFQADVKHQLVQRHWESWETDTRQYIAQLSKELGGSGGWSFDVIDVTSGIARVKPSKAAQALDGFERQALARIQAGATKIGRVSWDGEVRYIEAINMTKACAGCHLGSANAIAGAPKPVTGRMAVVSVRRPPQ